MVCDIVVVIDIIITRFNDPYRLSVYTYVSIQEMDGTRSCGGGEDCGDIINALAANGLGGRVIPFINISPGNQAVNNYHG